MWQLDVRFERGLGLGLGLGEEEAGFSWYVERERGRATRGTTRSQFGKGLARIMTVGCPIDKPCHVAEGKATDLSSVCPTPFVGIASTFFTLLPDRNIFVNV